MLFNGNLRPERLEKLPRGGMYVRTDGRTDGRMEINPCVLQDIGPLGPQPCYHILMIPGMITVY